MGRPKKTLRKARVLKINYNVLGKQQDKFIANNTDTFEDIVFKEAVLAIESTKKINVDLFELKSSCAYITINKKDFYNILDKARIHFEARDEVDAFELCGKCVKLMEKYKN